MTDKTDAGSGTDSGGSAKPTYQEVVDQVARLTREQRETVALLDRISEIAQVGGWELDVTTMKMSFSLQSFRINDVDPAVGLGLEQAISLVNPEARPALNAAVAAAIGKGDAFDVDLPMTTMKGRAIWVRTKAVAVVENGKTTRLEGTFQDITERKQTEIALREREARLVEAQATANTGSWETDLASLKVTWSQQLYRMFDLDPAKFEPTHQSFLGFVHPEDRAAVDAAFVGSFGRNEPNEIEHRIKTTGGRVKFIIERWRVVHDEQGRPVRAIGTCQDISERKRTEEALRESEVRWRFAIEGTGDGLWDWDVPKSKVFVSKRWKEMLGFSEDEIGDGFDEWSKRVHPDDLAQKTAAVQAHLDGMTPLYAHEHRVSCKDGSWKWILDSGLVVSRSADGKPLRMVGTHKDISVRRLTEARLAQADRLASMGMLASGVGHEINNPLAYVLANSDAVADGLPKLVGVIGRLTTALMKHQGAAALAAAVGDDAEAVSPATLQDLVECAQSVLEGTRRIQTISRRLGAFSRVERDTVERFDLRLAIESAATMANNEVKYRASLVKDFGEVPDVLASEGRLSQVFLNLFINAAHAIGVGNVDKNRITVRTWARGEDVFAEVADTGPGIPPANLERIFEPFFTTKKFGSGSGLGLSISRSIIAEFGGDIRVESEVGKGTRFIIRLPASTAEAKATPRAAVAMKPTAPTVRGRILVVDDEEQIRKTLLRLFGQQHEVVTVASGREAKALLEKDTAFDLILCDLMMPLMTGMALHAWLVESAPALAARVVFISGGAFTDSASEYMASVSNLRVAKPFEVTGIKKLVSDLIAAERNKAREQGG